MRRIIVIAHNIRSLYNVGSLFRTADAFDIEKIFLTGYTGCPPRAEIAKVALGAEKTVAWEYVKRPVQVIRKLQEQGYRVIALEQTPQSVALRACKVSDKVALLIGNEVRGVSRALWKCADAVAAIPMLGKKESLNVSVACGIALYKFRFYE